MSPSLVLLILEFFPSRLATQPYGLDSNVTQLLANLLTKPSVFYYLPIVSCNLVSIKKLLLIIIILLHESKSVIPFCKGALRVDKEHILIRQAGCVLRGWLWAERASVNL